MKERMRPWRPGETGEMGPGPLGLNAPGAACQTPADETGVGSSSSLARNRRLPLIALA
jgi:hypothetical protein